MGGSGAFAPRFGPGHGAPLPFGIFAAYALVRWRFPGRALLNGIVHLPLVLPPGVAGSLLLPAGAAAEVLGDPDVTPMGPRDAGPIPTVSVRREHADGLTERDAGGHALFLPRTGYAPGTRLRVGIAAQDVILSRARPVGLSALNILPGRVGEVRLARALAR